jgi:hypothetical protein
MLDMINLLPIAGLRSGAVYMADNVTIWWLCLNGSRKAASKDIQGLLRIAAAMMHGTIKSITVKQAMDFGFSISKPDYAIESREI